MKIQAKKIQYLFMSLISIFLTIAIVIGNTFSGISVKADSDDDENDCFIDIDQVESSDELSDFDDYEYYLDGNEFVLTAWKTFYSENMNDSDREKFIEVFGTEQVTMRYRIRYDDNDGTVTLENTIGIEEDGEPLTEIIPGLNTHNPNGDKDILLVADDEFFWCSELTESEEYREINFSVYTYRSLDSFVRFVRKVAKEIVSEVLEVVGYGLLKPALKMGCVICKACFGNEIVEFGARLLDMSIDNEGNYHADFNCWQQYFGYTDVYDMVFNAATSMRSEKFPFDVDGDGEDDYILWAWKGDYLLLGAGAELGIYKRWDFCEEIWLVDKQLAMEMTLFVDYKGENIISWMPDEHQWWITGFNPNKPYVDRDKLTATYTVTFNNLDMYEAFEAAFYEKNNNENHRFNGRYHFSDMIWEFTF